MTMKFYNLNQIIVLFIFSMALFNTSCSKDNEEQKPLDTWDIDKSGIPKFVEKDYIELDKIQRISKFRSAIGHDYSDAFEHCRSMKHYFEPKISVDWSSLKIFAPVTGSITRIDVEWAGTKIELESEIYPAFRFSIFHINTIKQYKLGDKVLVGEQLGTHIGPQTMSDISVIVNDPTKQGRMISYFQVMNDAVFDLYLQHGLIKREDAIISKDVRDANPLICNGDAFISTDTLKNWVVLK